MNDLWGLVFKTLLEIGVDVQWNTFGSPSQVRIKCVLSVFMAHSHCGIAAETRAEEAASGVALGIQGAACSTISAQSAASAAFESAPGSEIPAL